MTLGARVTVVGAVALALSSVPYVVAYLVAPADRHFMGIVSSVPDSSQYLAWMRGFAEHLLIENALTCEPQSPAFFNLQWLVLGQLSNWLPAWAVLQAFRCFAAVLFMWLTYRISKEYFGDDEDGAPTWTAWLLINLSAGFGWFWVLEKHVFGLSDARFPMDIYVYEPASFQGMIVFPHFLLAAASLLLIFRWAVAAIDEGRTGMAWLASLVALGLGLSHAYDLIIVYAVLGVYVVCLFFRDGFSWRPVRLAGLIALVSAPPPAYFVYLTTSDSVWRQVLAQFANAGVFTPPLPHLFMLVGVPLVLTAITWTNVVPLRWPEGWPLMVRVWAIVNFPLLYIPADYQIHMLSGWQIPLGLLATEGLFGSIVPRLARFGWFTRRRVVLVVVLLIVPTNVYLLAWRVLEVVKLEHTHYLYRDEMAALSWLDENAADDGVVLGSVVVSEYIPFLSGNKVYAGHWAQTVHFEEKRAAVARFFDSGTPDPERRAILERCGVDYVLRGRAERDLGTYDPGKADYLELVRTEGETQLYRVSPSALAAANGAGLPPPDGAPHERKWSLPQVLSTSYRTSWFADVTADPTGEVHALWSAADRNFDTVAYCRVGDHGCTEESRAASRPAPDGFYVPRPSVVVDAAGTMHLIWRSKYVIAYQKLFLPDPIDGWSVPRRLGEGTYSTLALGANGVLHAAWAQPQFRPPDACPGCGDITYGRSTDGGETWSKGVNLGRTPTGSEKPQLAAMADGTLIAVWEEGKDHYSGHGEPGPPMGVISRDEGLTWGEPFVLWDEAVFSPAIGVDANGTVMVVWRSVARDAVFYQTSNDRGATWTEPLPIAGLRRRHFSPDELDGMELAADAVGALHLVATSRIGEAATINAVYHFVWDGESWSPGEEIFRTEGTAEWPRIAVANGNELHAVWFERNKESVWSQEKSRYRIYYSHSRAEAPGLTPAIWPPSPPRALRRQTVISALQIAAAMLVVGGVMLFARRRGM